MNCGKFSMYVSVFLSCRNLKTNAFNDLMIFSAKNDFVALVVEYSLILFFLAEFRQFLGKLLTFIDPFFLWLRLITRFCVTKLWFDHCCLAAVLRTKCRFSCNALLNSAAVFFCNGNAQTKQLSVSTTTKMRLTPWLYLENFCISTK